MFSDTKEIQKKYIKRDDDPSFIVMTIDPGAGASETAIISGYFIHEKHNTDCFTAVVSHTLSKKKGKNNFLDYWDRCQQMHRR